MIWQIGKLRYALSDPRFEAGAFGYWTKKLKLLQVPQIRDPL